MSNLPFFLRRKSLSAVELKSSLSRDACIVASLLILPYCISNYLQGDYVLAFINLLFIIYLGGNAWLLHTRKRDKIDMEIVFIAGALFIFFGVYRIGPVAVYAAYIGCVASFLLLKLRHAVWYNVIFIILMSVLLGFWVDLSVASRAFGTMTLVATLAYILTSRLEHRNQQLVTRTQELERASMAKSEFLANMSHEMRTPLTTVAGYSESMLDDSTLEPQKREQLEAIVFNTRHLASLIDDILDLSRIEAGDLRVNIQKVELAPVVASLVFTLEETARGKGLDFVLTVKLPLPRRLHIDAMRLKQILFNLIGNAIKFTNSGFVELAISYDPDSNRLMFRVIDSGIGIPTDYRARLFQQFSQADSSIIRDYGGTGLGLYISQRLAELLNGHIEHFPQARGSIFQLSLQLESTPEVWVEDERSFREVSHSSVQPQGQLTGHVLIAEDSSVNRLLIKLLVEKCGLQTTTASNGQEAVELARNNQIDLILMDLQMPIMSGIEAANAIREFNQQIPIIALSADVLRHEIDSDEMASFTGGLAKPIDTDLLRSTFARFLPAASTRN
jgi:signal transduction histidine kinase/CheY-like chemotaxis protein